MEPSFLTANWGDYDFPQYDNDNNVPAAEWDEHLDSIACLTHHQWVKMLRNMPAYGRPSWIVPGPLYTFLQPQVIRLPPTQELHAPTPHYRQQIITNTENDWCSPFAQTMRDDLVHHSRVRIPIAPTGQAASIDMDYLFEILFEPAGQFFSVQLRDPTYGRTLKLDVQIWDAEIVVDIGVNHRRMNHVDNDQDCDVDMPQFRYWDME